MHSDNIPSSSVATAFTPSQMQISTDNIQSSSHTSSFTPTEMQRRLKRSSSEMTPQDFKGCIAPVLTCFHDDEFTTLNVEGIDKYAAWLKREKILGVCVNSILGEGPALGVTERHEQVETWWSAAVKHELLAIIQIGGAPLPDVLQSAEHAEDLGVHAVLCLPELFYKPSTIKELVGYCKIVAKKCETRPFLYYHIPELTGIYFDMNEFCSQAESSIPNFMGILYSEADMEYGSRCLREGRVVLFDSSFLMAGASLLGFESFVCGFFTVRPDIARSILKAMRASDLTLAMQRQKQLNDIYQYHLARCESGQWVEAIKAWFNLEILFGRGPHITAGPVRKFFLQKSI